jgi:hypothetical protein
MKRKPASLRPKLTARLNACGAGCITTEDFGTIGPFDGCSTDADMSVELGRPGRQEFTPFVTNEEVPLESAAQGSCVSEGGTLYST